MTPEQEKRFDELRDHDDCMHEEKKALVSSLLKEEREKLQNFTHTTKCEHGGYNFGCALCLDAIMEQARIGERHRIRKEVESLRADEDANDVTDHFIADYAYETKVEAFWYGHNEGLNAVLERLTPDTNQTEV